MFWPGERTPHRPQALASARAVGAFTLIELLVVLAVIALLVALVMPALGRARSATRSVTCLSNVRQVNMAMWHYTQEHDGRFMPIIERRNQYWFHLIARYLGAPQYHRDPAAGRHGVMRIMVCPETSDDGAVAAKRTWNYESGRGSYGLNLWLTPFGRYERDPLYDRSYYYYRDNDIRHPSHTPVFADSRWVGSWPDNMDVVPPNLNEGLQQDVTGTYMGRFCLDHHDRYALNVAYHDTSARKLPLGELWQLYWHRESEPRSVSVP